MNNFENLAVHYSVEDEGIIELIYSQQFYYYLCWHLIFIKLFIK